jgi:hypothetical protein
MKNTKQLPMIKKVQTLFLVSIIIASGVFLTITIKNGVYKIPASIVESTQVLVEKIPTQNDGRWPDVINSMKTDCKKVLPLNKGDTESINYYHDLFTFVGSDVFYDSTSQKFISKSGKKTSIMFVPKYDNAERTPGETYCWYVWQGEDDGTGTLVYETTNGKLKSVKTKSTLFLP